MTKSNTLNLNWEQDWCYYASMPEIPGHPGLLYKILVKNYDHPWRWYSWEFALPVWLSPQATSVPYLYNEDFDIPAASTAEKMMQAVDSLTADDIVRVLTAKGYIK